MRTTLISDNTVAESKAKILRKMRANSFEVGDAVITCSGHLGIIESFSTIIDDGGWGNEARYYRVDILDTRGPSGQRGWSGPSFESQTGEWMTHALSAEEVLGEEYFL